MSIKPDHNKDILVVAGDVDMSGRSFRHMEMVSHYFVQLYGLMGIMTTGVEK